MHIYRKCPTPKGLPLDGTYGYLLYAKKQLVWFAREDFRIRLNEKTRHCSECIAREGCNDAQ